MIEILDILGNIMEIITCVLIIVFILKKGKK